MIEIKKMFKHNIYFIAKTCILKKAWNNGDLEMIQWLHKKNSKGCTTNTMNWAAEDGRLDVVKFLHENRKEGCTKEAMDAAAANGYLDTSSSALRT